MRAGLPSLPTELDAGHGWWSSAFWIVGNTVRSSLPGLACGAEGSTRTWMSCAWREGVSRAKASRSRIRMGESVPGHDSWLSELDGVKEVEQVFEVEVLVIPHAEVAAVGADEG